LNVEEWEQGGMTICSFKIERLTMFHVIQFYFLKRKKEGGKKESRGGGEAPGDFTVLAFVAGIGKKDKRSLAHQKRREWGRLAVIPIKKKRRKEAYHLLESVRGGGERIENVKQYI